MGKSSHSPADHMRRELGESWDHFLQAANHAATGVGTSVGPRANKMKLAASRGWDSTASTLAPLAEAYRAGAKDAHRGAAKFKAKAAKGKAKETGMSRKKVGVMVGLVATGAAVGAAGALVMRRRKQQQWSEFDGDAAYAGENLESVGPSGKDELADQASGAVSKASDKMSEKVSHKASKAMDKTADKLHSAAASLNKEAAGPK